MNKLTLSIVRSIVISTLICLTTSQSKAQYSHFEPLPYVPEPEVNFNTTTISPPPDIQQSYLSNERTKDQVYSILSIEYASINNKDVSQQYQNDTAKLVIYRKNGVLCMSIFMLAKHSQSFGSISNVINSDTPASNMTYYSTTTTFDWSYSNSYNSETGLANVLIKQVNNPSGTTFFAEIRSSNMDVTFQGHKQR